jgi:hypothetical protein
MLAFTAQAFTAMHGDVFGLLKICPFIGCETVYTDPHFFLDPTPQTNVERTSI